MRTSLLLILCCFSVCNFYGQNDSLTWSEPIMQKTSFDRASDPLSPSRAAFYSAVLPGLGQIYNKSYWKLPLVYGGIGVGLYFYFDNQSAYQEFRDIYKRRLSGHRDDKYYYVDDDRIRRSMRIAQRQRDLSLAITVGIYILNIVDANVDAHLKQFDISEDLTVEPSFNFNQANYSYQFGMSFKYNF